jgi:hypothetical protein
MALTHLFYGGSSFTLVGRANPPPGVPRTGVMYGVAQNGDLLWYSYFGQGKNDRSGSTGWLPNSGNPIGNGWQDFRALFGGLDDFGQEVIYAVAHNGDLLWYRYEGNGENDRSGNTGWNPNSGNPIGNGW